MQPTWTSTKFTGYLFLLVLIVWLVAVRWLYLSSVGGPLVSPDTYGYYLLGNRMLAGTVPVINDARSPVYPLFLAGAMAVVGQINAPMFSAPFFQGMWLVVVVQSFLGIVSTILLYQLLEKIGFGHLIRLLLAIFIGSNILIFAWERVLVTESLTTFWLMATTYSTFLILQKTTPSRLFWLLTLFVFGFLIKPVYLALPLVILPVIAWYKRQKSASAVVLILLVLYTLVPLAYVRSNLRRFGYPGVAHVTDINLLGKILQYNLPAEVSRNHIALYQALTAWREQNGRPDPYSFLEFYDPQLLVAADKQAAINEIKSFVTPIILANAPRYLILALADVPKALIGRIDSLAPPNSAIMGGFWHWLWRFDNFLQSTSLIFLPLLVVVVATLLKPPSLSAAVLLTFVGIGLYHVLVNAFLAYEDYGRLLSPAIPQVYLFCIWTLVQLGRKFFAARV